MKLEGKKTIGVLAAMAVVNGLVAGLATMTEAGVSLPPWLLAVDALCVLVVLPMIRVLTRTPLIGAWYVPVLAVAMPGIMAFVAGLGAGFPAPESPVEVTDVADTIEPVQDAENGGIPDSVPDAGVVPGCAVGPDGGTAAPGTLGRVILHEAAPGAVVVGSIEGAT